VSTDPNAPKPVTLHARQDVNVQIDPQARIAAFACAHPDGLLGAYQVVIPFHQLKRVAAGILNAEGMAEVRQLKEQQHGNGPKLVRPT